MRPNLGMHLFKKGASGQTEYLLIILPHYQLHKRGQRHKKTISGHESDFHN